MRKHIVVAGENATLLDFLTKAVAKRDLAVVAHDSSGDLPPATAAIAGGAEDADMLLTLAEKLGDQHEELLRLIAWAGDVREGFPSGDSERVQACASRFGRTLKLNSDEQLALERAALARSIGKFCIPNAILLKRGLLTHDEWSTLRKYPAFGAEVVMKTAVLRDTEPVIRAYRECFDGTGYPQGLEGDAIPRLSQALLIADVYCAMTSVRPYRESQNSPKETLEYFKSERGKKFNPELVDAFIKGKVGEA